MYQTFFFAAEYAATRDLPPALAFAHIPVKPQQGEKALQDIAKAIVQVIEQGLVSL